MVDSREYYRREAADAQDRADRARTDEDRAAWLRIAQSWLGLIKLTGEEQDFETRLETQGTHQNISSREQ
jgi:hypothetical protein